MEHQSVNLCIHRTIQISAYSLLQPLVTRYLISFRFPNVTSIYSNLLLNHSPIADGCNSLANLAADNALPNTNRSRYSSKKILRQLISSQMQIDLDIQGEKEILLQLKYVRRRIK
uniref:Uncharacterized protein n=1 Tax=Arundo donax TaxID=35708 RepID=A0A0A8ZS95_ARUDO